MRSQGVRSVLLGVLLCAAAGQLMAQMRPVRGTRRADHPRAGAAAQRLAAIGGCDELREYMTETILEMVVLSRYGTGWWFGPWSGPWSEVDGGGGEPGDFTTTNVQEEGVDELDIVKTDGNYVYTVHQQELLVLDSWPAETAHLVSRVKLEGFPAGLFLFGDRALVISSFYASPELEPRMNWGTRLEVVDLTDRSRPELLRSIEVEGWLNGARLIGSDAFMVISSQLEIPYEAWDLVWRDDLGLPEVDWDAPEEEREAAAAQAKEILRPLVAEMVDGLAIDDLVPLLWDSASGETAPLLECSELFRPADSTSHAVLSVVHLDLAENEPAAGEVHATGLLSDGWEVYASARSLYVAQSSRWWWWLAGDLELETAIHAFDLGTEEGSELSYRATGVVDGWLLNSFAMSEHEGVLRVATTEFDWWWNPADEEDEELGTRVTVLEDNGEGLLVELGKVTGIAPGEALQAARFMGDTGFLVTFERVDPLFTLDLSDPTSPRVLGELEIPGFSSYLHPMEEGYLLAVGRDGREDGTVTGLAVSIFDVRDLENPQRIHQYTVENESGFWSWSEALWDHHAFTFHRGVLSIPAYIYSSSGFDGFSGLVVLEAGVEDGISELGRIDHSDLAENPDLWYESLATMRRSLYIENFLFSLSDRGIKVNELEDPALEYTAVPFY